MKAILPCTALYLHPQSSLHIAYCTEFALKHKSLSVNIMAIATYIALYLHPTKLLFQLDIVLQATIFYMGILYAVVIALYMLYRIRVESEEFIRQYESDPAMYSNLPAPAVVIAHYIAQNSSIIAQYKLYKICVESEDFNHQYESDTAMYSTLPAPVVVIPHCILHRIHVETQKVIRQYHSDPAMYSTLHAPTVVIAHCILHRIRVETQEFNRQYHSDPAM